jgi:FixJ family two-component response regulator
VAVFEESQRDQAFLYKGFDQERDGSPLDLHVFSNKEKFIQFLQSAQKWKGVLVIDIASSGLPGLELLERIRLNSIVDVRTPIIILSEKRDQNIQDRAKQLGVASFYKRPSKQEQWWHVARAIRQSWLGETSQSADHNLAS